MARVFNLMICLLFAGCGTTPESTISSSVGSSYATHAKEVASELNRHGTSYRAFFMTVERLLQSDRVGDP